MANVFGNSISIYRNLSTGGVLTAASIAPRVDLTTSAGAYSPFGIAVADVDGDGKLDIVTTDYSDNLVSVFRNVSAPGNIAVDSFAPRVDWMTGADPQSVAVQDLDGDGRPELLVANAGDGTVSVFRNLGTAGSLTTSSFAPKIDIATDAGCDGVAVADLDGDGKPDVVTANSSGTVSLLRNLGTPGGITINSFAPKVGLATLDGPVQLSVGDLDGDGKPDITVTCYLPQTVSVFRNLSTSGSLTTGSFAPAPTSHWPVAATRRPWRIWMATANRIWPW